MAGVWIKDFEVQTWQKTNLNARAISECWRAGEATEAANPVPITSNELRNFLRSSLSSARILAACSHILYTTLILNKSNLFAVKKNSRYNLSAEMFGGRNKDIIKPDFSWNPSQWFVERTSEMLYKEILDAICIHTEQIWLRVSLLVSLSWNLTASQNIGIDLTSIPDARLSEPDKTRPFTVFHFPKSMSKLCTIMTN